MNPIKKAVGTRPYPKDYERKAQVMQHLYLRGMTQQDLALKLAIPKSVISEVISGTRRSLKTEEKISSFFGMSREELFPSRTFAQLIEMRRSAA